MMISEQDTNLSIKAFLLKYKPRIESEIEKYIPRKASKEWIENALGKTIYELDLDAYTAGVNVPVWDLLDRGGKRLRPLITCICAEAVGGKWEDGMKVAPMVEIIHNGTLMQDDVEDDSKARRGEPCTHHKFGIDTAVNTGTLMYFWPLAKILTDEYALGDEKRLTIYDLYATKLLRVCSGQVWDIAWHRGGFTPSEEQYLNMCLSKTGVLTEFACQLGAIMGNATQEQHDVLGKYGQFVGVGFQLQDDILELTEGAFKAGKGSIGGDIHEGKRTLIVLRTLDVAEANDKKRLVDILDSHTEKEQDIHAALDIINKYDGIPYAKRRAETLVAQAWRELDAALPDSNAKIMLHKITAYLTDRKI
jgi:geranylgeranyl pyrophosphate synthase